MGKPTDPIKYIEWKQKLSEAHKGKAHTEETKQKMSKTRKGRIPWNKGKPGCFSPETIEKFRLRSTGKNNPMYGKRGKDAPAYGKPNKHHPWKGKHHTEETKQKMSISGKGRKVSKETRKKLSDAHKGKTPIWAGKHHTEETKKKISIANKGKECGELAPNWKGGISFEPYCPKFNKNLKERVRAFFEYRCIICGKHEDECNRKHSVHHVNYDKRTCCNEEQPRFAAVCIKCHSKTNWNRSRWENIINRAIDEIYNGKSYYTIEEWKVVT
jgi:hypothetical protein